MADPHEPPRKRDPRLPLQPVSVPGWPDAQGAGSTAVLLTMVLVIATAGLVYELVMAAVASYVLGDSVRQFSLVIGIYLSALGLGAYLSRYALRHLAVTFVEIELGAALVGGLSAPTLFLAFGFTTSFQLFLFSLVGVTGTLVGLELPLLMRILERRLEFRELVARALTFDYAGALVGSLAFSLFLVPRLGLTRTSAVCGLLNALVGLAATWLLPAEDESERRGLVRTRFLAMSVIVVLGLAVGFADRITEAGETAVYPGQPLLMRHSAYQRIVVTRVRDHFELYLNGNLQFSSADEYRYHEALVHPAASAAEQRRRVFVGGGGDGLAVREILRWPDVQSVTLVDLDPLVTDLAQRFAPLTELNEHALSDPRVNVINEDAMAWLATHPEHFDVMVLDFPDPSNYSLGKLYSREFYALARGHLRTGGALVVQASSPFFARRAFWCVVETMRSAGLVPRPYWAFVPSFGDWGYVLAKRAAFAPPTELPPEPLRFLEPSTLPALFAFPPDLERVPATINRLNNQALVGYYLDEWSR